MTADYEIIGSDNFFRSGSWLNKKPLQKLGVEVNHKDTKDTERESPAYVQKSRLELVFAKIKEALAVFGHWLDAQARINGEQDEQ